jgi:hypothetical protein
MMPVGPRRLLRHLKRGDVYVGEWVVLDIEASTADGAQIGHASAMHTTPAVTDRTRFSELGRGERTRDEACLAAAPIERTAGVRNSFAGKRHAESTAPASYGERRSTRSRYAR